jgi:hypothetical protein
MFRKLTSQEIAQLEQQGCTAKNWDDVEVAEAFNPSFVRNVHFSGHIQMGVFGKEIELPGGLTIHSGIYNATIHNCEIGDDAHIYNVHNYIANYHIGRETCIENVNAVLVDGRTTFGNGVRVPVMNEGGGREIPIFNELSASLAYVLTLYRHRPKMIQELERQIDAYAEAHASDHGYIGDHVRIVNCGSIKNVHIGDFAVLKGVSRLKNGTINSNEQAPVRLGSGVKCIDFIIALA